MAERTLIHEKLKEAGVGAFFRPRDIETLGFSFRDLKRLVDARKVEKITAGLYRLRSVKLNEFETLAMTAVIFRNGIVCLLSALSYYGIGTQIPHEIWIAIDRKARKPSPTITKVRLVRFSGVMLSYGIVTQDILGVQVRITSPSRTVVDCFRYRNKIGIDVAIEALRDAIQSRKASVNEIIRTAEVCRVSTVIRPYLEALVA